MKRIFSIFTRGFVLLFCTSYAIDYDHAKRDEMMTAINAAHEKLSRSDSENLASDWAAVGGYLSNAIAEAIHE